MARLFQASTISAIEKGHYDYTISIEYFLRNGDTGIGTYNGHNGEAIFLDGVAYNGCASGEVKIMDFPQTGISFGAITKFNPDVPEISIEDITDLDSLYTLLSEKCMTKGPNYFYVVKIVGHLNEVTVSATYKQRKPFRPLSMIEKEMRTYDYKDLDGTLVGIYAPKYLGKTSFNGWCVHFLSDDKLKGGKVIALKAAALKVKINLIDKWEIKLPNNKDFVTENFTEEVSKEKLTDKPVKIEEDKKEAKEKVEPVEEKHKPATEAKEVEKPVLKVDDSEPEEIQAKIENEVKPKKVKPKKVEEPEETETEK